MNATPEDLYHTMFLIRRFEETVLDNFSRGLFFGTTHTCLGQEANAAGVLCHLAEADIVFSNHRCHGHFLAYGGEPRRLFAELMGRSSGVCGGRGGSQHLQWRNFYSNGVQGGIVPVATGMALAEKFKHSPAIVTAFLGDGTLGEGVVYEALNMAALWQAPIFYVVENNHIAQTTPSSAVLAGSLPARFQAFGIPCHEIDTSDVLEISQQAGRVMEAVRETTSPRALVIHTCRFGPHSKGDDTREAGDVAAMRRERDPIAIHGQRIDRSAREALEGRVNDLIQKAFEQAQGDPFAEKLTDENRS